MKCQRCNGTGDDGLFASSRCHECRGTGELLSRDEFRQPAEDILAVWGGGEGVSGVLDSNKTEPQPTPETAEPGDVQWSGGEDSHADGHIPGPVCLAPMTPDWEACRREYIKDRAALLETGKDIEILGEIWKWDGYIEGWIWTTAHLEQGAPSVVSVYPGEGRMYAAMRMAELVCEYKGQPVKTGPWVECWGYETLAPDPPHPGHDYTDKHGRVWSWTTMRGGWICGTRQVREDEEDPKRAMDKARWTEKGPAPMSDEDFTREFCRRLGSFEVKPGWFGLCEMTLREMGWAEEGGWWHPPKGDA